MADGGKPPTPEKKSWADVEEEEEAKAKAAAAAEAASSSSSNEPAVDAQAKQIEALSLSVPEEHGGSGSSVDHSGPFEPPSAAAVSRLIGRRSPAAAASALSLSRLSMKPRADVLDRRSTDDELELVKERFSKLLLGEDMSGGGKGVCTAVAISNAITNLYGTQRDRHDRRRTCSC
jgi:hypothetical protein